MAGFTANQRNKLLKKLKSINIITEKDILNVKVSDLKKLKEIENIENLTMKDIEILWLMQEAIEKKSLLEFFADVE